MFRSFLHYSLDDVGSLSDQIQKLLQSSLWSHRGRKHYVLHELILCPILLAGESHEDIQTNKKEAELWQTIADTVIGKQIDGGGSL